MVLGINSAFTQLRKLQLQMESAPHYQDWELLARQHDQLSGQEKWKRRDETTLYDFVEIRIRHDKLRQLLDAENHSELLYALNEGLHGNMAGMGRPILYAQSWTGTKYLIDEFVSTTVEALRFIAAADESKISLPEKIDFFRRASHCYGRSALMLSGGAGLIYFHHGVVQTLIDENLLPNVLSGSSAGSWVCAQLGTHTDAELKAGYFDRYRYDMPDVSPLDVLLQRNGAIPPLQAKDQALDNFDSGMTFQEAYELTGRYISVSIAPAEKYQNSRLMNAITSPNVYIRSAIDASSSIPGLFPPVTLYAKGSDGRPKPYLSSRKWVDGSTSQDLPAKRLARLFGVNHYLVSMINPLAAPFVNDPKLRHSKGIASVASELGVKLMKDFLHIAESYSSRFGIDIFSPAFLMTHAVLDQKYTGDINMILNMQDFHLRQILHFFQEGEIEQLVLAGKRSVWPRISMIRNTSLIGRVLDEILEEIDQRELQRAGETNRRMVGAT